MTTLAAISLLAPSLVLGAGLVVLPIVAHLLNRKARRRVTFPSIVLLVAATASQSSMFKMRRWWLLLLRCLAVFAIVLAFMQPVWQWAHAGQSPDAKRATLIVIDTSASTGQLIHGIPVSQSLQAEADRILDSLKPGKDVANIIFAAARPRSALPVMADNFQALQSDLKTLKPTAERADLNAALSLAGRMLAEHDGQTRLFILSDLQQTNWTDTLTQLDQHMTLPDDVNVAIYTPPARSPTNLSIHSPVSQPTNPRVGQPFNLHVTVANHSEQMQSVTVHASIGEQALQPRPITIEPRQSREVVFTATLNRPGEHRAEFKLSTDALAIDNTCYQVLYGVEQTPILLISDDNADTSGASGGGASYFISRALAPHGSNLDRFIVNHKHSSEPFSPDINSAAAVFIGQTQIFSDTQLSALHQYIESGGGVIFFATDINAVANLSALESLKPDVDPLWQPEALRIIEPAQKPLTITHGDWRSPLLSGFSETAQHAFQQMQINHAWVGGHADPNASILLRYQDDTPALLSRNSGAGRIMIANFSPDAKQSDLGKHSLFVALMQCTADYLQNTNARPIENHVGRSATLSTDVPIDRSASAPTAYLPDGRTPTDASLVLGEPTSDIIITSPDSPGFYTARQGDTLLGTVAVNIDPREGDLQLINADEITAVLTDRVAQVSTTAQASQAQADEHKGLWGWPLLVACVLLAAEMFLLGHWRR